LASATERISGGLFGRRRSYYLLMEALRDVQAVVPTIYAISHDPQLQALFSGTVMIEQDDLGVSRIVAAGDRNGGLEPSEMATVEANQ